MPHPPAEPVIPGSADGLPNVGLDVLPVRRATKDDPADP